MDNACSMHSVHDFTKPFYRNETRCKRPSYILKSGSQARPYWEVERKVKQFTAITLYSLKTFYNPNNTSSVAELPQGFKFALGAPPHLLSMSALLGVPIDHILSTRLYQWS